jgi:quercetin dioxygenase-like cupin family protein
MEIIRSGVDVIQGRSEHFTGVVLIHPIVHYLESQTQATSVHFTPGSRSAWHTHPGGETILVTEGVGICQRRGEPIEVLRRGDRAILGPGEEHWHGAAPTERYVQLSMVACDDENRDTTWMELISDNEYTDVPPIGQ